MPLCHWEDYNHYELMMQSTFTGVMFYPLRDQTAFEGLLELCLCANIFC